MPSSLLAVKFYIPKPRPLLTERAHLLDRFSAGLVCPLTLISAPAGFGKSTLLSAWLDRRAAGEGQPFVISWLSLDAADNHPSRFWTYLAAAIQAGLKRSETETGAAPGLRLDDLLDFLQSEPPPAIQPVLDQLINALTASPERILLVLDDYHAIQAAEIHEQMTYLVEHQPPNLRLVLSTRVDPPLPLTRLRARGQLSEFRAADLRFTSAEAEQFFKTLTGLEVSGENLAAIQDSTEGWVAGLQMAALALNAVVTGDPSGNDQQGKINEFVGSFSGKHLYILDYLTDEVFSRQPAEIQEFLLKTSILERMSAGLCAEVRSEELPVRSEETPLHPDHFSLLTSHSQRILDSLDRANLFTIRLDAERQWFRYHHLFADLLRARLEQTRPEIIPGLHLRASQWYAQNGFIDDAIQHATAYAAATRDWEWASRLMEMHVVAYLERGQLAVVLKWIDSLPNDVLLNRPVLCSQVAWALAHAGQFQRVPPLIQAMDTALSNWEDQEKKRGSAPLPPQELDRLRGISAALRAFGCIMTGKQEQAVQIARQAIAELPGLALRELAWLHWMCGYAYRGMGRLDEAIRSFETALELNRQAKTVWEDMSIDLGIAYRFSGRLKDAIQVFEDALLQAEKLGLRNKGNLSRVEAFLSGVLADQNRLEEALAHAQKGVYYLQWWPGHNHITTAYAYLGQAYLNLGRLDEAAEAVERAEEEQYKGQVLPTVLLLVDSTAIRLWIKRGQWDRLDHWLSAQDPSLPDFSSETRRFTESEEMRLISLARVWIAKGRQQTNPSLFEQAVQLLSQVEIPAGRSWWVHALIEIHLLQAVALRELGRPKASQEYLTRSLALGLPAGYARVYLQEGAALAEMLQAWLRSADPQAAPAGLKPYMVKDLLDQFGPGLPAETTGAGSALVEPLTDREQEVLQLLALGLSNKEMAGRMVVSEGTVKTHVHNLIGKLSVQSRMQVLARARELNLL